MFVDKFAAIDERFKAKGRQLQHRVRISGTAEACGTRISQDYAAMLYKVGYALFRIIKS